MSASLIVEEGLVAALDSPPPGVILLPRAKAQRWRKTGRWASLDPEVVVGCMASVPRGAGTLLARSPAADPGAACARAVARAFDHDIVELPLDPDEATWSVAMAGALAIDSAGARRALDVICCGPSFVVRVPHRHWLRQVSAPALRPATLSRWAECAWCACRWCRGGAAPSAACRRCGLPVGEQVSR